MFAADATFDAALGQALFIHAGFDRPGGGAFIAMQRGRGADAHAFAAEGAARNREVDARITILHDDNLGRADDRAVVAARAFAEKFGLRQGPGRTLRGRHCRLELAAQEAAARMVDRIVCHAADYAADQYAVAMP